MNKSKNVNFDIDLEEARDNFKLLNVFFEEVVYSGVIVLESNGAAKKINGTIEANVLNVIRYSMRKNAVISLRKIFEKSGKEKKSNIDFLVKFVKKFKYELAASHFKKVFQENRKINVKEYINKDSNALKTVTLNKKQQEIYRLEFAKNSEKEYLNEIEQIDSDWNEYFVSKNFEHLIENRTVLAHSMDMKQAKEFVGISFDSMKEYLDKAAEFMNRIDILINNNKTNYESFFKTWKKASQCFWNRII